MQDHYVGDVGDFGKFGLLRHIHAQTGLRMGINWYYVDQPAANNDGRHIGYLHKTGHERAAFEDCDRPLYHMLGQIIAASDRRIAAVEQHEGLLPHDMVCFRQALPGRETLPGNRSAHRQQWVSDAHDTLRGCELVFLDPDNGLAPRGITPEHPDANKYATLSELTALFAGGKSVLLYQHRNRMPREEYRAAYERLAAQFGQELNVLHFHRGTARDYVIFCQPEHRSALDAAQRTLLQSSWRRHFTQTTFPCE